MEPLLRKQVLGPRQLISTSRSASLAIHPLPAPATHQGRDPVTKGETLSATSVHSRPPPHPFSRGPDFSWLGFISRAALWPRAPPCPRIISRSRICVGERVSRYARPRCRVINRRRSIRHWAQASGFICRRWTCAMMDRAGGGVARSNWKR
jgi:hypothetical protein